MFSKSRTMSNGASPAAPRAAPGTFSVIGADVTVTGDVAASADLHIDGQVQGDISCASLVQGENSRISGGIIAESARLAGAVDGSVDAKELVIERTARVTGDIAYERITIDAGGHVEGRFTLRGGALLTGETDAPLKLVGVAAE